MIGVGRGMGVLDEGKGRFWGFLPHWFEWYILKTEMYSIRAWKIHNFL